MSRRAVDWIAAVRILLFAGLLILGIFLPLPALEGVPLCFYYARFGRLCPGCGMTRAAYLLMHGHPIAALRQNPFILVVLMAGYMGIAELSPYLFGRQLKQIVLPSWLLIALGALLIVFCIARNIGKFL